MRELNRPGYQMTESWLWTKGSKTTSVPWWQADSSTDVVVAVLSFWNQLALFQAASAKKCRRLVKRMGPSILVHNSGNLVAYWSSNSCDGGYFKLGPSANYKVSQAMTLLTFLEYGVGATSKQYTELPWMVS